MVDVLSLFLFLANGGGFQKRTVQLRSCSPWGVFVVFLPLLRGETTTQPQSKIHTDMKQTLLRFLVFLVVVGLSSADKFWSDCSQAGDSLHLTQIDASPMPVVIGQQFTVKVSGFLGMVPHLSSQCRSGWLNSLPSSCFNATSGPCDRWHSQPDSDDTDWRWLAACGHLDLWSLQGRPFHQVSNCSWP